MQLAPDKLAALTDTARALEAAGVPYALIGDLPWAFTRTSLAPQAMCTWRLIGYGA